MKEKELHNQMVGTTKELITQQRIARATAEWQDQFHIGARLILAPRGFEDRSSNGEKRTIAKLEFLTKARIEKAANVAHGILKDFKQCFAKELLKQFSLLAKEKIRLSEKIVEEESKPWYARHKKLLQAYKADLFDIETQLKVFNGIEYLLHTVTPDAVERAEAEEAMLKKTAPQEPESIEYESNAANDDKDNAIQKQ